MIKDKITKKGLKTVSKPYPVKKGKKIEKKLKIFFKKIIKKA